MIILKNHFNEHTTVIYANAITNGCQTFYADKLDEVCQRFNVPNSIKQDVLDALSANQGLDNVREDISKELTEADRDVLRVVAFATQNMNLLDYLLNRMINNQPN